MDDRRRGGHRRGAQRGALALGVALALAGTGCSGDDDTGPQPGDTLPTATGPVPTQATTLPDPQLEPADPAAGTTTVLGDGEWYAYVQFVDPPLGVVVVDVVDILTGAEAVAAAAADGAPTPVASYVDDDDPGVAVDVPIGPSVAVTVLGADGGSVPSDLDQLAAAFAETAPPDLVRYTQTPYLLDVRGGVLVSLAQQAAPA